MHTLLRIVVLLFAFCATAAWADMTINLSSMQASAESLPARLKTPQEKRSRHVVPYAVRIKDHDLATIVQKRRRNCGIATGVLRTFSKTELHDLITKTAAMGPYSRPVSLVRAGIMPTCIGLVMGLDKSILPVIFSPEGDMVMTEDNLVGWTWEILDEHRFYGVAIPVDRDWYAIGIQR